MMFDPDAYSSVPDSFDGRDQVDVELPTDDAAAVDRPTTDRERTRLTAEVLRLLDESFRAHASGDTAAFDRAAKAACALDVDCVSVVQGGILIGEIPSPERDPAAWADYVAAAQEAVNG